jgi:preprotein translocase subunit SecG
LQVYLDAIQIIVSAALIVVILLQGKQGSLGGLLGGDSGVYRTRRGIEKTLHSVTIVLAVTFFVTSLITVLI